MPINATQSEQESIHAAHACGHGDELGILAPGLLADLSVVQGDPLEDLQVMGQLLLVIKNGEIAVISEEMEAGYE